MVEVQRIGGDDAFAREFKKQKDRIKALETGPAGKIVSRETIETTDPDTGIRTIIGILPDGSHGIQPFVGDVEPPPVATIPRVSAEPGLFAIYWDGQFANGALMPRDFEAVLVKGYKLTNGVPDAGAIVGRINKTSGTIYISTDVALEGEEWQFAFVAVDFNGNLAPESGRSATNTMRAPITYVDEAWKNLKDDVKDAQEAAQASQESAQTAQDAADSAASDALAAAGIAAGKGKVIFQPTPPDAADRKDTTLWIDTSNGANTPKRWNGNAWVEVTDKVAKEAAQKALAAETLASQAFNRAVQAAEAAGLAQESADGKNSVWYTDGPPTGSDHKENDLWFDPENGNRPMRWNGTQWVSVQDQIFRRIEENVEKVTESANGKNTIYYSATAPVSTTAKPLRDGDTWFDTANGNRIKVWSNNRWNDAVDQAILDAALAANTALASADGKSTVRYSSTKPSGTNYKVNDIWFDPNNGNMPHRWNGTDWVSVQDQAAKVGKETAEQAVQAIQSVQQTVDGKNSVYYQTSAPTSTTQRPLNKGDLWFDTDDNYALYTHSGSAWIKTQDSQEAKQQAISAAQAASNAQSAASTAQSDATRALADALTASNLAATKGKVMIQATAPTGADANAFTLWIDTTGGANTPKRWVSGTNWQAVTDKAATDAAAAAVTAKNRADAAFTAATDAATLAGQAQTSANGKARVWYTGTAPAGTGHAVNDLWFDSANGNKPMRWSGSAWVSAQDAAIAAAQSTANQAVTSANGKNKTYYQTSQPTGGTYVTGDTWFDTDDNYALYTYSGSAWIKTQDSAKALNDAKADATAKSNAARDAALAVANSAAAAAREAAGLANSMGRIWFQPDTPPAGNVYNWVSTRGTSISELSRDGVVLRRNLITNPRFLNSLNGWSATNAAWKFTATRVTSVPAQHRDFLGSDTAMGCEWAEGGTNGPYFGYNLPVALAEETSISFKLRAVGVSGNPSIRPMIEVFNEANTRTATIMGATIGVTPESQHDIVLEGLLPAGTGRVVFAFYMPGNTGKAGDGLLMTSVLGEIGTKGNFFDGDTPDDRETDLWIDTDEGNTPKRWNGSGWAAVTDQAAIDAAIAAAAADATAKANAAQAAAIAAAAQDATNKVATKNKTWIQTTRPDLTGNITGDTWIDTSTAGGNKLNIWNGSAWVDAQDAAIAAAKGTADTALTAANGKNKIIFSTSDASGTNYTAGDMWMKRDSSGAIIGQWEFTTSWQKRTIAEAVLGNLSAGKITSGTINADRIGSNSIDVSKLVVADISNQWPNQYLENKLNSAYPIGTEYTGEEVAPIGGIRLLKGRDHQTPRPNIPLRRGDSFTIEAVVKRITGDIRLAAGLWTYRADGTTSTTSGFRFTANSEVVTTLDNGWERRRWIITYNNNTGDLEAAYGRLYFQIEQQTATATTQWLVSDITVRRRGGGELLVDGSIKAGSAIIAEGAIGNAQIGEAAITTAKIADAAITDAKIDNLNASKITAGVIAADRLNANDIRAKLITAPLINAGDIIAQGSITSASGTIGSLDASVITSGYISSARIEAGSITIGKVSGLQTTVDAAAAAKSTVDGWKSTDGKLKADVVTGTLPAAVTVPGAQVSGTVPVASVPNIPTSKVTNLDGTLATHTAAANKVTQWTFTGTTEINGGAIRTDTITAAQIKAGSLTSESGVFGVINAGDIKAGTLSADRLNANDIRSKIITADLINAANILVPGSITATNGIIGSLDAGVITAGELNAARIGSKSITVDKLLVSSTDNLVQEADFGGNGAGWTLIPTSSIVATAGRNGGPALRFTAGSGNQSVYNSYTAVGEPNANYRLTAWIKPSFAIAKGGTQFTFMVRTRTATGTASYLKTYAEEAIAANQWGKVSGMVTIPDNAKDMMFCLELPSSVTTGTVDVDFASVTRATNGSLVVDGSITSDSITTSGLNAGVIKFGEMDGARIKAESIDVSRLLIGTTDNLVSNPKNVDGTGWVSMSAGPGSSLSSKDFVYPGTVSSQKMAQKAAGNSNMTLYAATPNLIPVSPGESFYVSSAVYATGEAPVNTIDQRVYFYDASGAMLSGAPGNMGAGTALRTYTPQTWFEHGGIVKAPADAVYMAPRLTVYFLAGVTPTNAIFYVGNIKVFRAAGATLIENGAVTTDHMTSGTIDAKVLTAGSIKGSQLEAKTITADRLVLTSTDNMIMEADFSNGGYSWQTATNRAIQATAGRGGTPALRFSGSTGAITSFNLANKISIGSDQRFRAAISAKSTAALTAGKVQLMARCYTTATAYTDVVWANSGAIAANTWTMVEGLSPKLPNNTIAVEFYLRMYNATTSSSIDVDYVSVTRASDASLIVDGSVTAAKLETDLVLATKIVAGDPTGIRAEMSPQGFKVFGRASGDTNPNPGTYEIVRLGVADTNDMFAITDSQGVVQASIAENGVISGKELNAADEIMFQGTPLSQLLWDMPRGHVASAYRITDSAYNAKEGGEWAPYLRLDVEVERHRLYKITTSPIRIGQDPGGAALVRIGMLVGGIATPSNYINIATTNVNNLPDGNSITVGDYAGITGGVDNGGPGDVVLVSFLLMFRSTSKQFGIRANGYYPVRLMLEDMGPRRNTFTGVHLDTTSTNGVAPTPPPAKTTRTSQWDCNWIRSFDGNTNKYLMNDGSKGYQGLSPAGVGNLRTVALFPDMTETLSSSVIHKIEVYIYFEHWYYNAGGTARIGVYGTGQPTNYGGSTPVVTSGGWPKPGGRWVTLPTNTYARFQSGALRGITLEGDGTYQTYGIAHPPKIRITYTK